MNTTTSYPLPLLINDTYSQTLSEDFQTSTAINLLYDLTASLMEDFLNDSLLNDTTISEQTLHKGTVMTSPYLFVQRFVIPPVCAVGIVLNVLNLLVLTEDCLKESPFTYLTAMAVFCLATLIMTLCQDICMQSSPHNYYCYIYVFNIYFPCVNICTNSTVWLTATLTIERFLFVKLPLWARAKCGRRAAKIKICVVTALMMVLNIPRFLLYKVVQVKHKGPSYYTYERKAFRLSKTFTVITWIYSTTIQIIPLSILCVCNFYLVYAVHRARRLRKRMHIRNNMEEEWSREQTRLTVTLVAIVFFFLICIMPSAFTDFNISYALFGGDMSKNQFKRSHFYVVFQTIANLLVFCQLSFNFILYSAFNNKFLAVFRRMLRRWGERIRQQVSGRRSSISSNCRLMRLGAATGLRGGERKGSKVQLRSSNTSTSSGKDTSQTKNSLLIETAVRAGQPSA